MILRPTTSQNGDTAGEVTIPLCRGPRLRSREQRHSVPMRPARLASAAGFGSADIAEPMYLAHWPSGWSAHALARQRGNQGQPRLVHRSRVICEPDRDFPLKGGRTRAFLNVKDAVSTLSKGRSGRTKVLPLPIALPGNLAVAMADHGARCKPSLVCKPSWRDAWDLTPIHSHRRCGTRPRRLDVEVCERSGQHGQVVSSRPHITPNAAAGLSCPPLFLTSFL